MTKKNSTKQSQETQELAQEFHFENSLKRLEEILDKMNSGSLGLDEAVRCYEEADQLIGLCHNKLVQAEQKVEMLIKNREGRLQAQNLSEVEKRPFDPNHTLQG